MASHVDIHLIHPVEFGDGAPHYVVGFNDDQQALKLSFELGVGKWQMIEGPAGNAFCTFKEGSGIPEHTVMIPHANTALLESWND